MRPRKLSSCHPNASHYAKGLCYPCYKKRLPNRVNLSKDELLLINGLVEDAIDYYVGNPDDETYKELEDLSYKISKAIQEQR